MKFGPILIEESLGAIAAHKISIPNLTLKKGDIIDADILRRLQTAGLREIVVARLEEGDVGENWAARILAEKIAGAYVALDAPFTGRCNVRAARNGVTQIASAVVDAVNAVDEAMTLATLKPFRAVVAGELIATVKIIPFAVPEKILAQAMAHAGPCVSVAPFIAKKVAVIATLSPGLKESVLQKTLDVLRLRLAPAKASLICERRTPHEGALLAGAITEAEKDADIIIIFGASAIADRRDVIPSAIEAAGGRIAYFGMPVDPGNLLLLARGALGAVVIGAPGCARSPALNGFDFVLQRLLADLPVCADDLKNMGVGGLLKEILARPQPRG